MRLSRCGYLYEEGEREIWIICHSHKCSLYSRVKLLSCFRPTRYAFDFSLSFFLFLSIILSVSALFYK